LWRPDLTTFAAICKTGASGPGSVGADPTQLWARWHRHNRAVYTPSVHDRFMQKETRTMKGSVTEYTTGSIEEAK
jgi:hypothetical protein